MQLNSIVFCNVTSPCGNESTLNKADEDHQELSKDVSKYNHRQGYLEQIKTFKKLSIKSFSQ